MIKGKRLPKMAPIDNQLLLTPAHKLSEQIKAGNLTSVQLCEAYANRLRDVQPHVNAMAESRFEQALEEARRIDNLLVKFRQTSNPDSQFSPDELELLSSPLLGVPISIKESIQVDGMRNSCGLWSRRDVRANEDAIAVKNAKRFGLVPICTSNVPECTLFWADCQNKVYGRSVNPYDINRITGASSGGEGSLLGAGASLIGIGSDIGGSLRIPAHYCGIYSHKPSPFLVSAEGNYPALKEGRLRMFTMGPMCRYASDLKPLLKCLLSDKDNSKQDTYYKYQPANIKDLRDELLAKLDDPVDISQLKLYYFKFNETSQLKGKQSIHVQEEMMEAQSELLDYFQSKFNCQIEELNLDEYLKKAMITWQCMLRGAGNPIDRDTDYSEDELKETFGIDSLFMEFIKMPLGLSKHTKESLLIMVLGSVVPKERSKAYPLCEKFESFGRELKAKMEAQLGEKGVLIMPTMPTTAYKHNEALLKTNDLRFPAIFNVLQVPVTHATMRLSKKHQLPFGFSLAAKPYNDNLTLALAEEIEIAFGGWTEPCKAAEMCLAAADSKHCAAASNGAIGTDRDNSRPVTATTMTGTDSVKQNLNHQPHQQATATVAN